MATKRVQQKEHRRKEILWAAAGVFARSGYNAASIADIAAEMGAPKSAVGYHQFASKKEIASALVALQQERWQGLIETVTSGPGTGLTQLLTILYSAAIDARNDVAAAAAAKLSAEQRAEKLVLPAGPFEWRTTAEHLIRRAQHEHDLPDTRAAADVVALILTASYGLFTAENNELQPQNTGAGLLVLWRDLLTGIGVGDADAVIAQVTLVNFPDPLTEKDRGPGAISGGSPLLTT